MRTGRGAHPLVSRWPSAPLNTTPLGAAAGGRLRAARASPRACAAGLPARRGEVGGARPMEVARPVGNARPEGGDVPESDSMAWVGLG